MPNKSVYKISETLKRSQSITDALNKKLKKMEEGEGAYLYVNYTDSGEKLDDEERLIFISMIKGRIERQIKSVEKEQKIADAIEALYQK